MKKTTLGLLAVSIFLISCASHSSSTISLEGPSSGTWHSAQSVDATTGDYPNIFYGPDSSLYVTYSLLPSTTDLLYLSERPNGQTTFNTAVSVTGAGGGRTSAIYFSSAEDLWLATENYSLMVLYQSQNAGSSWTEKASYLSAATTALLGGFRDLTFAANGSALSLYFGYSNHGFFGDFPQAETITYSGTSWSTTPTVLALTGLPSSNCEPISALQLTGTEILGCLDGVAFRSTNGVNFTAMQQGSGSTNFTPLGEITLRTADGMLFGTSQDSGGTTSDPYTFAIWDSSNSGTSWTQVNSVPGAISIADSRIQTLGRLVVAVYSVGGSPANELISVYSTDGGTTWSQPSTLVNLTSTGQTIRDFRMAASSSRIGLVYSVEDSGTRQGVELMEFY